MKNEIKNKSSDRQYFTVIPRIVWAKCRNVYDKSLWETIKTVAGDDKECYLSTSQLAVLSMMSVGQVSKSRKYLLSCGLLKGHIIKDVGYANAVWHLSIPDLWEENIKWAKKYSSIKNRIKYKKEQKETVHLVKASQGEPSTSEKPEAAKPSPGEAKKNQDSNRKHQNQEEPNPPGKKTPGKTTTPKPPSKRKAAEILFTQLSGIPAPPMKTVAQRKAAGTRWWQPINQMLGMADGDFKDVLREAIAKMRADELTIAAPQSVVSNFTDIFSRRVVNSANGSAPTLTAEDKAILQEQLDSAPAGVDR